MEYCKTKLELVFILNANWLIIRIRFIHEEEKLKKRNPCLKIILKPQEKKR